MNVIALIILCFSFGLDFCVANGFKSSFTKVINPSGGEIEVSNIIKVKFPRDSFKEKTNIEISTVETIETKDDFTRSIEVFPNMGPRLPHEIRILTNIKPQKSIIITLNIPKKFAESVKTPLAFAQMYYRGEHEILDNFEVIATKYNSIKNTLELEYPSKGFTDNRRKDNKFEAILIVGSESKK